MSPAEFPEPMPAHPLDTTQTANKPACVFVLIEPAIGLQFIADSDLKADFFVNAHVASLFCRLAISRHTER